MARKQENGVILARWKELPDEIGADGGQFRRFRHLLKMCENRLTGGHGSHTRLLGLKLLASGTPEGTRTPNLLIRSQTLYPIELRVRCGKRGAEESPDWRRVSRFSVCFLKNECGAGKRDARLVSVGWRVCDGLHENPICDCVGDVGVLFDG
jgi:hypothetical protein